MDHHKGVHDLIIYKKEVKDQERMEGNATIVGDVFAAEFHRPLNSAGFGKVDLGK